MSGAELTSTDGVAARTLLTAASYDAAGSVNALAQTPVLVDKLGAASLVQRAVNGFRTVSAANTQNQQVIDLGQLHDILDIVMVASGGAASVTVEGSVDNVNWSTIDTLAAALTVTKHYNNSTVGAGLAVTPLAFRYVRITTGAAGVGNTTTTTVTAK